MAVKDRISIESDNGQESDESIECDEEIELKQGRFSKITLIRKGKEPSFLAKVVIEKS